MKAAIARIITAVSILSPVALMPLACYAAAASPVAIQIDAKHPAPPISANFSGLGFEMHLLLPNEDGKYYFRPDNQPLITLFHTLGIKSLRVGGNTSDRDARRLPNETDIDSFFGFARAAGVKVIFCLRLHNGDTNVDAQTVKYIMDHYEPSVDCFSIGQEPSAYPMGTNDARASTQRMGASNEKYSYTSYRQDWKMFSDTIIAAVPNVQFCGPSVHNNGEWARHFMEDFGRKNHVALITEHLYPGGAGGKVPTPEIGQDRMLSDDFVKVYQKLYKSFVPAAVSNGLPYRLEEVNNFYNGGAAHVSNTFASSLWGLDFMYWWAEHQASGVNFHTGDRVAAGNALQASKYTAFFTTTNGYLIRPLGYGIKTFDLGSHGRFVPATVANSANLNLSAYAVLAADKNLYVTLINKEHGDSARAANITLAAGTGFTRAESISLVQASGNVAATDGVTIGGAEIKPDGTWSGTWEPLDNFKSGTLTVTVAPASAIVVKLVAE